MPGKVTVVIGGQYGSEAKGKVASFLANEFDMAVRTGAPNAGHTVINNGEIFRLQQIPVTFVNPNCVLCIGAGGLIDPEILKREVAVTGAAARLFIDPQAGVLEEKHVLAETEIKKTIGSTGKGCGAALVDRIWRKDFKLAKDFLKGYRIADVAEMLNNGLDAGKNILVEGTQGFGLSIYHGNYPFTTSRDTTAANFLAEAGLSPRVPLEIILVIRTYPIRVAGNSGPLKNETTWAALSQKIGREVVERTTVTKNIRRVAEFDGELVKKAIMINRSTQIALQFLNYLYPQDENKTAWASLSKESREYIVKLERELGVPITLIGTGQGNAAMIDRR